MFSDLAVDSYPLRPYGLQCEPLGGWTNEAALRFLVDTLPPLKDNPAILNSFLRDVVGAKDWSSNLCELVRNPNPVKMHHPILYCFQLGLTITTRTYKICFSSRGNLDLFKKYVYAALRR